MLSSTGERDGRNRAGTSESIEGKSLHPTSFRLNQTNTSVARRRWHMPELLQGNVTEARLLSDERFLRRIAYLYYGDGHSQEAIAGMEFCSRQTVSKAFSRRSDKRR